MDASTLPVVVSVAPHPRPLSKNEPHRGASRREVSPLKIVYDIPNNNIRRSQT